MTVAPSLLELQRAFSRSVFAGDPAALAPWIEAHGLAAGERLQIYRNMVFNTLTGSLQTSYPAVLRLLGADCFAGVAARYIAAEPSSSGNLQDYGATFADFLAMQAETAALPYLADVARLEWARQQACLAADATPLDPERLASLPEEQLAGATLTLHPSVQLIDSRYPVFDVWRFCQQDGQDRLQLNDHGQSVLLWRSDAQIALQLLTAGGSAFIAALQRGIALGPALVETQAHDPGFDLAAHLQLLLQHGLLVEVDS